MREEEEEQNEKKVLRRICERRVLLPKLRRVRSEGP